jgi:hypothetical protein
MLSAGTAAMLFARFAAINSNHAGKGACTSNTKSNEVIVGRPHKFRAATLSRQKQN